MCVHLFVFYLYYYYVKYNHIIHTRPTRPRVPQWGPHREGVAVAIQILYVLFALVVSTYLFTGRRVDG